MQVLTQKTTLLDQIGDQIPPIVDLSKKHGFNTGLPVAAVMFVSGIILMLLQGWQILVLSLTVLYPGLHSIRAIESPEKDDDKIWLTYWMIFGIFNVLETFFGFVFYFIPYWEWIRLGLFVFLLLPQFNGAQVVYESFIRDFLAQHKD